jgi:hypothetical protein
MRQGTLNDLTLFMAMIAKYFTFTSVTEKYFYTPYTNFANAVRIAPCGWKYRSEGMAMKFSLFCVEQQNPNVEA